MNIPTNNVTQNRVHWVDRASITAIQRTVILAIIGLCIVLGYWKIKFGSIGVGIAILRGERLIIESSVVNLGSIATSQPSIATLRLSNQTGSVVNVLGARSSCKCTSVTGLPLGVQPGRAANLSFQVNPKGRRGRIEEFVELYTDYKSRDPIHIRVIANIVEEPRS